MATPNNERVQLFLNRPALERLLGGDSELEVQLRHQIVNEFAKKHLRAVVLDPAFSKYMGQLQQAAETEIKATIGKQEWSMGRTWTTITPKIKELIDAAATEIIKAAVARSFEKHVEEYQESVKGLIMRYESKLINEVTAKVKEITATLDARVDKYFEDRVQAEAKRRLEVATKVE